MTTHENLSYSDLRAIGFPLEMDASKNDRHQFSYAAMILIHVDYDRGTINKFDLNEYAFKYLPPEWDITTWKSVLEKPFPERIAIASVLCKAESDRIKRTGDQSVPYQEMLDISDEQILERFISQ